MWERFTARQLKDYKDKEGPPRTDCTLKGPTTQAHSGVLASGSPPPSGPRTAPGARRRPVVTARSDPASRSRAALSRRTRSADGTRMGPPHAAAAGPLGLPGALHSQPGRPAWALGLPHCVATSAPRETAALRPRRQALRSPRTVSAFSILAPDPFFGALDMLMSFRIFKHF